MLVTGEVPRTTGYEPGFPPQQAWLGGSWQADPLVLDDQALIINVKGKGLVVITGCGHAGVVNIASYARRLTGSQPLYALLGGFHLNGPLFEPLIPRVLDDLAGKGNGLPTPDAQVLLAKGDTSVMAASTASLTTAGATVVDVDKQDDDLAAMNPGVLVPAHCTGWRAQHAMSARFPAAYTPNTVGTSFHL